MSASGDELVFPGFRSLISDGFVPWSVIDQSSNPAMPSLATKKSLLRTLEARMMADAAGAQLLMLQDRNDPTYRERLGTNDYPHLRRLRSSYL